MPQKESKAVPEGNDPVTHQEELGSNQPMMTDFYRMINERIDESDIHLDRTKSHFNQQEKKLGQLMEMTRGSN